MALSCGLIGLPMVGKTTLFNLLTGNKVDTGNFMARKGDVNRGMARVPDYRVEYLVQMYNPRKTTLAQLEIMDVPGLVRDPGGRGRVDEFLDQVRRSDALVHVIRVFSSSDVLHVDGSIDVMRDFSRISDELILADMQLVETRLERLRSAKKKAANHDIQMAVLEKCAANLEDELPLSRVVFNNDELKALENISFLTDKPLLLVVNLDEEQLVAEDFFRKAELVDHTGRQGLPMLEVSAKVEEEINQLPENERGVFLTDLGLKEPGITRLARAVYTRLGLISFLTAGEDEVKAWTVPVGTSAKKAAGKIHSDIERGFIRAEVVAFEDLESCGSMARAREKGLVRLEGKEYQVQDGDIINFRFNV